MGNGSSSEVGGRVLAVPYANFEKATEILREGSGIDVAWHIEQILKQASERLITYMQESEEIRSRLREESGGLTTARCQELFSLLETYGLAWDSQRRDLQQLFPGFECGIPPQPRASSPLAHLEHLVSLLCSTGDRGLGFDAIYVLIDSLDQVYETADLNQDTVLDLILPLIANQYVMCGIPNMAIKCFIPQEIRARILANPALRNIGLPEATIGWSERLTETMLHRRLRNYKKNREDSAFTRIESLCVPELRDLGPKLFKAAKGNPRSVVRLCDFMVEAHIERALRESPSCSEETYLLNLCDWAEAQARFEAEAKALGSGDEAESEPPREPRPNPAGAIIIHGNGNVVGNGSRSWVHQELGSIPAAAERGDTFGKGARRESILLVLANPKAGRRLYLGREQKIIETCLQSSLDEGSIELKPLNAATFGALRQALLKKDFTIVHFSVHGYNGSIIMEREDGTEHPVSLPLLVNEYLARYPSIHCIVLNACQTNTELISTERHRHVITVRDNIHSDAAIAFSRGFYDAIAAGQDVTFAFDEGLYTMKVAGYNKESEQMIIL